MSCRPVFPVSRRRVGGLRAAAVLLSSLLVATAAAGLTYVMPTDDELLERAEVVVMARVLAVESAPSDRRVATDYLVEIDDPIKGFVPASTILVRVPGGVRPDGMRVRAFGVPELAVGERALLFLSPQATGTYRLVELGLGTFRVAEGPRPLLVRDLSSSTELRAPDDPRTVERARSHLPRDLERFTSWLRDAGEGRLRDADYFVDAPGGPLRADAAYTLTVSPGQCGSNAGLPVRWTEFENGDSVRILVNQNLQPGVADGGIGGVQRSIAAWNSVPQSRIKMLYGGTTAASASALVSDERNLILFEDPFDDIDGEFRGSGTLAVTWVAFDCAITHTFRNNDVAHTLFEADLVTQDGSGSFYFSTGSAADYDEVIGHELGHFLGIGHACGDSESPSCGTSSVLEDALMNAVVHGDNRGARLNNDDRAAARFLYAGETGSNQAPVAPSLLTAVALSTSEIQLNWVDNADNETSFVVEERTIDGDFVTIATLPANTTSLVVDSIPEGSFRAYQVSARNANGTSTGSNEASATTPVAIGACVEDGSTLCLNEDRFRVRATYQDFEGAGGEATTFELTDDTGYFYFFDPDNVEVVVKVLDACGISDRFWVFAGGLTNVEVVLTVSDTTTGDTNTYFNALGDAFLPVQDTAAFATCP